MKTSWFTYHEQGGFPVERAALGSCDLSVLHVGDEWQWLVRQLAATWRKVPRPLLMMRDGRPKLWRSS
jgi:hypothetical protein